MNNNNIEDTTNPPPPSEGSEGEGPPDGGDYQDE